MSRRPDYDVVILGGGLAGLSLGTRLIGAQGCRTLIVEPRTDYVRDRTWCYWPLVEHPFRAAVSKAWPRWEVTRRGRGNGGAVTAAQASPGLPYEMIPSDRLYGAARDAISRSEAVELRLGCRALATREHADRVSVETSAGTVTAAAVFDSRPPPPIAGDLVQRFLGQEVTADRPVFDPGRVTLMDFAVPQVPGVVHFLYVLPTSPTEAFVEDTWFAPADAALPDYRATIRTYLAERFGIADYAVGFEEEGGIPMSPGLQAASTAGRVITIGTAGGAVKPSSGYGFTGVQRMTGAIAADLLAGRRPTPFQPRSATARWMDAVLLRALRRCPEDAPHIFERLFARCRPEPLIRFLNDVGSPADIARVIAAMPKIPMIAAAARSVLPGSTEG